MGWGEGEIYVREKRRLVAYYTRPNQGRTRNLGMCPDGGPSPHSLLVYRTMLWLTRPLARAVLICSERPEFLPTWTCPQDWWGVLRTWRLAVLKVSDPREQSREEPQCSCDLVSQVTHHGFCHMLFIRSQSQSPAHTQGGERGWRLNTIS